MRGHVCKGLGGLVTYTIPLRVQWRYHTATLVQRFITILFTQHCKQALVLHQVFCQHAARVLPLLVGTVLSPVEGVANAFLPKPLDDSSEFVLTQGSSGTVLVLRWGDDTGLLLCLVGGSNIYGRLWIRGVTWISVGFLGWNW